MRKKKLSKEDQKLLAEADKQFRYEYWKRKQCGRTQGIGETEKLGANGQRLAAWKNNS